MSKTVKLSEVQNHKSKDSCWVIIHGKAYDVTDFLPEHPGGQKIILRYAGKDATKKYDPIHPSDTLDRYLPKDKHLGNVIEDVKEEPAVQQKQVAHAPASSAAVHREKGDEPTEVGAPLDDEALRESYISRKPDLGSIFNLFDFEHVARHTMSKNAWGYYSSAADDEITMRENHAAFHRITFRPKVLIDVSQIDLSTTMLGTKCKFPFYITATALGKLGHSEGERALNRGAGKEGVIYMVPTLGSYSFDEVLDTSVDGQTNWLQIYVNSDRQITKEYMEHAEERGVTALHITVDAPQLGRREKDMRAKYEEALALGEEEESHTIEEEETSDESVARSISSMIDPSLNWSDLAWFRKNVKGKITLKGIQRAEDALLAVEYGVDGIIVSNHGGRQLDTTKPSIEILEEVMAALRQRGWENKIEVYLDGGVRRGTDILKALCLGAKGVGLGRPFLYAMSSYGEIGVRKAIRLLRDELIMNMRLIGCTKISDLDLSFLDNRSLPSHSNGPIDSLFAKVYDGLHLPPFKPKI